PAGTVKIVDDGEAEKQDIVEPAPQLPPNASYEKPQELTSRFTDSEREVLERLAARRIELDNYARDLEIKAGLVEASSKKLDEKLAGLKQLKEETEVLLASYREHEDVKIRSLVKIYENMKPKDA